MDPYLEDPGLWPDVHHELIGVARELLIAQLRPKYFVQIDERLYLANDDDEARALIVPDLRVRELAPRTPSGTTTRGAAIAPGIELAWGWELEVREGYLQVIDRESGRVVTVVEILSPANKVKGSAAKRSYDEKKRDVLAGHTNLVEIDLLREGTPLAWRADLPPHEYMAQVWRWDQEDRARRTIWPMGIREPLKVIPVPVRPEDADAALDLQRMVDVAYERAGYELRVDYRKDPVPALANDTGAWARGIISSQHNS
jgi:hypothetical protein